MAGGTSCAGPASGVPGLVPSPQRGTFPVSPPQIVYPRARDVELQGDLDRPLHRAPAAAWSQRPDRPDLQSARVPRAVDRAATRHGSRARDRGTSADRCHCALAQSLRSPRPARSQADRQGKSRARLGRAHWCRCVHSRAGAPARSSSWTGGSRPWSTSFASPRLRRVTSAAGDSAIGTSRCGVASGSTIEGTACLVRRRHGVSPRVR